MPDTTPTTDEVPEYYQIRINKKIVKKIALVATAAAVVTGAVLVKKNLVLESGDSGSEAEKSNVNGV